MKEPKYTIGQTVYLMPTANVTVKIGDRTWDESLKPEPSYRYKVEGSPAWFPERCIKSTEEMPEYLESIRDPDGDIDTSDYDADTGRAFINGIWVVVNDSQWERFLLSWP